jgi:thioredoxin-related protein
MQRLWTLLIAALLLAAPPATPKAGLDTTAIPTESAYQLVVLEAEGCIYCHLFRRDVLPGFAASEQGRQLPVRFLDINAVSDAHLDLQTPVDIVPTFIVVKNNKEVGRIPGYVGPENFYHSISYLLSSAS